MEWMSITFHFLLLLSIFTLVITCRHTHKILHCCIVDNLFLYYSYISKSHISKAIVGTVVYKPVKMLGFVVLK